MTLDSTAPRWFVLNHFGGFDRDLAQKTVDRFNAWQRTALELFAPTYVVRDDSDGKLKFRTVSLTFHYVFVRGCFAEVKQLCAQSNGFSFLLDRGSEERYAIISDRDMEGFRNIARAYKNCLPYYPLDGIDLEDGDLVEVVNGDFPGLVGTFMPKAKSRSGNIVLNVYNNVGTIAFDIKASDVRVLEFGRNTTRANDQIDAFVPHLLAALRLHHDGAELPVAAVARLSIFCRRMEVARLDNRKLDAKLQALLYAANVVIGDMTRADAHRMKYDRIRERITNGWTRSLCSLAISVAERDEEALKATVEAAKELQPQSRQQKLLAEELAHYAHP